MWHMWFMMALTGARDGFLRWERIQDLCIKWKIHALRVYFHCKISRRSRRFRWGAVSGTYCFSESCTKFTDSCNARKPIYLYFQSIFWIQNSEYAFHFICVFSETYYLIFWCMFLKIDWKYTYRVECIFWILNSENWLKIQIYWFARITWICKFCTRSRKTIRTANSTLPEPVG